MLCPWTYKNKLLMSNAKAHCHLLRELSPSKKRTVICNHNLNDTHITKLVDIG